MKKALFLFVLLAVALVPVATTATTCDFVHTSLWWEKMGAVCQTNHSVVEVYRDQYGGHVAQFTYLAEQELDDVYLPGCKYQTWVAVLFLQNKSMYRVTANCSTERVDLESDTLLPVKYTWPLGADDTSTGAKFLFAPCGEFRFSFENTESEDGHAITAACLRRIEPGS